MKTMTISDMLAHNITMAREDADFINIEKASVADALYAISSAKANLEDEPYILEKLDIATEVIMSYLFYLDIFAQK